MITFEHVMKSFKEHKAVDDVSFSIQAGEMVTILGPNGAGKTTTLSMLLGLIEPTEGTVQLFGQHPKDRPVRERIGAMLQDVSVMDGLTGIELIRLFRSYYKNPLSFEQLIGVTGMSSKDLKKRTEKLSGGQKRRLSFALAIAGNPDVLFLDEPTVGLDVTARRSFWETIRKLNDQGKTIIFTTHYLQEAEDVADRIILIHKGKVVADGNPLEMRARFTKKTVSLDDNQTLNIDELGQIENVSNIFKESNRIFIETTDSDAVLAALYENKVKMSGIQIEQGRLETVFEHLTADNEEVLLK